MQLDEKPEYEIYSSFHSKSYTRIFEKQALK